MRVLRVSHSGVVGAWRERERELRRRGIDAHVCCAAAWNEGGSLVRFAAGSDDAFAAPVRTVGTHPNLFIYDPRPLWRALGESWDLIDIHEEPCSLAAAETALLRWLRRVRAPYLLYSAQNIDKRYPPPFRWVERHLLRHAAGVSVCNSEAGRILRCKGLRGSIAEIPLGVDIDVFSPARRDPPTDSVHVGYVGRLELHKGVDTLIRAVATMPASTLTIVGSGPEEIALRQLSDSLGVSSRASFAGHAAADELAQRYRTFDVLAVPSLTTRTWIEQFGRVVVEAMASGVPVVASRSGALPDVVGDAGLLAEPGEPQSWAAQFTRLRDDPSLWAGLREAGLRRARQFTWSAVAGQMHELYLAALGTSERHGRSLEIVVVAYGSSELLAAALEPVAGRYPITVVDNSSQSDTRAVTERFGARYLDPGRNLGFGAGVNYALDHGIDPAADVLLLNPDAVVAATSVATLHDALASDPRLACVAPSQVDRAGARARVSWPFPSPQRAWSDAAGLGRFGNSRGFVIGSVLLLRAEALTEVGGFDERFFLYAEEVDWQRRAVRAGWNVREVLTAHALHEGGGTSNDGAQREAHFHAAHEIYIRKHYGSLGWVVFRGGALAGAALRSVAPGMRRRHAARSRFALYWNGPRVTRERMISARDAV